MLLKLTLFSILNIYFQANAFHLGYHRNSIPRAFPEKIHENSINSHPEILELDQSGRIDTRRSRNNEERNETRLSEKSGSFVNCVFTLEKTGEREKPEYVCTHSKDVDMKWHEEKGRLTGIFTTSLRCPKKRSVHDEKKTSRRRIVQELKQSIREKRHTIYRDDVEEEDTQDENPPEDDPGVAEAIIEEAAAPGSEVTRPPDAEEAIADENDKEHPGDDESEDKSEKEVNEDDIEGVEGSDEDKEVPGAEKDNEGDGQEDENEVEKIEHKEEEEEEEEEEKDKEVSIPEETKDEPEEDTIVPSVEETNDEEDVDKEIATAEETQDEQDVDKEISTTTEKMTVEVDEDKEETDKDDTPEECCPLEQLLEEFDLGTVDLDIGIGLELVIDPQEVYNFIASISDTLANIGDYIISFLLDHLKQNLHHSRMNERFDKKVAEIAKNDRVNIHKALEILRQRILKLFGTSYEILLIKFLKELQDKLKLR